MSNLHEDDRHALLATSLEIVFNECGQVGPGARDTLADACRRIASACREDSPDIQEFIRSWALQEDVSRLMARTQIYSFASGILEEMGLGEAEDDDDHDEGLP